MCGQAWVHTHRQTVYVSQTRAHIAEIEGILKYPWGGGRRRGLLIIYAGLCINVANKLVASYLAKGMVLRIIVHVCSNNS